MIQNWGDVRILLEAWQETQSQYSDDDPVNALATLVIQAHFNAWDATEGDW